MSNTNRRANEGVNRLLNGLRRRNINSVLNVLHNLNSRPNVSQSIMNRYPEFYVLIQPNVSRLRQRHLPNTPYINNLAQRVQTNRNVQRAVAMSLGFNAGRVPQQNNRLPPPQTLNNLFNRYLEYAHTQAQLQKPILINSSLNSNTRNALANMMQNEINAATEERNNKKQEARNARAAGNINRARQLEERAGYWNSHILRTRTGLRALRPLRANINAARRARLGPNVVNNSPVPNNNKQDIISMNNLNTPHVIINTPGVKKLRLNPNTVKSLIKEKTGANIANNNLRNWLRIMRENNTNEPLFRHPLSGNRNVTAAHIKYSS